MCYAHRFRMIDAVGVVALPPVVQSVLEQRLETLHRPRNVVLIVIAADTGLHASMEAAEIRKAIKIKSVRRASAPSGGQAQRLIFGQLTESTNSHTDGMPLSVSEARLLPN